MTESQLDSVLAASHKSTNSQILAPIHTSRMLPSTLSPESCPADSNTTRSSSPSLMGALTTQLEDESIARSEEEFGAPATMHLRADSHVSVLSTSGTKKVVGSTPTLTDFMTSGKNRRSSTPSIDDELKQAIAKQEGNKKRSILSLPFLSSSNALNGSGTLQTSSSHHVKGDSKSVASTSTPPSSNDWASVANEKKQGNWRDLTVDVSTEDMEIVVQSWKDMSRSGQLKRFGELVLECLLSQNPAYVQHIPDPSLSPLPLIFSRIVEGTGDLLAGKDRKGIVAEFLSMGNKHMNGPGIGLKDYKCGVVAVTYALTDLFTPQTNPTGRRYIRAWQILLRETSAIMHRGGMMSDEDVKKMKKEVGIREEVWDVECGVQ
ncbi:hypothetical protein HDU93_008001 [Gonapodya sp. JEL0774]|nr:hypothetical protein HDU93_008001 [Gonapodya sp. JEL0774]